MIVHDEAGLGEAIKNQEEKIEIRGDLSGRVARLKAIGVILWCACFSLLAITIAAILAAPPTFGISAVVGIAAGTPAAGLIGVPTATTAVLIAVAGGGIGTLARLRSYRMVKAGRNHIVLYRR